jgi:hypothetical protein
MNKEQRLRRLKAMVGAQKIVSQSQSQESKRYVIEVPGYSLRRSTRSSSPHEAINQMVQEWVREGSLIPSNISEPLRVKLTDFGTKQSSEFQIPIEQALSGSTSYPLPNFGGYDETPAELGPNVEEHERYERPVGADEQAKRDDVTGMLEGLELISPSFNQPRVLVSDPTMQFNPDNINSLIYRSKNKAWITIPEYSRKKGIPNLYELTGNPTDHEKYFGVKTEYGYVPTMASSVLLHLATKGGASRGDMSDVRKLQVPEDYPLSGQVSNYIITLPASVEEAAIRESFVILQEAHQKPSLLRRLKYKPGTDNFEYTTSHTKFVRETDPQAPLTPEMKKRMQVLNRGLAKPIIEYRRLNALVEEFVGKLDSKMTLLLKEQHSINSSSRFLKPSGKRDDVDDILRNIILRKVIGALQGSETFQVDGETLSSPLESAEFAEEDYSAPS